MARKRKIPARKHHGVRDPLKQLEKKEKRLSKITNNPPERDNQQVSFKFTQFKKLVEETKAGKKIKKIHKGREDMPKEKTHSKKMGPIQQLREETDEDYLKRVNRVTSQSLREAQYEAKYGVNVVRNAKTGEISIHKKPKNEIDELIKEKQKNKCKGKSAKNKETSKPLRPMDPKMAKELIKQAIKEGKEEQKSKKNSEIEEYKHDFVAFGEVVHAPPTSLALPRKAQKAETVPRPGKKASLLLKSLLPGAVQDIAEKKSKIPTGKVEKVALSGKRKKLPLATRKMLDDEREKFIELYRNMKKTNMKAS